MANTTFDRDDVERLGRVLGEVSTGLDEEDRELLHVMFALAGSATANADGDEVSGFSVLSFTPSLSESFMWGYENPRALNPQPLPPVY
jgi:hypothetical protein